jgi:exoribonuclease R
MIAANGEVAKKLVKDFGPNALVIHHPKPSEYNINNLNTLFSDFGVIFKNDSIISLEN